MEDLIILLAKTVKRLNSPHIVKYFIYLLAKDRLIPIHSKISYSGAKIDLNLGDFIDFWIFVDGIYEGRWIQAIAPFVNDKILIDVGANIGIYPLSLYKQTRFVYAFEPEMDNFYRLCHNLQQNSVKNVQAIRKAVYKNDNQILKLYINKANKGWHSLHMQHRDGIQRVSSITLDTFIRSKKIKNLGMIKIDVEGAEIDVLQGLQQTMDSLHPPLLIEFNTVFTESAGYSLKNLYNILKDHNYFPYRLIKGDWLAQPNFNLNKTYNENILFR